ncbi:SDR family oxidoreductase [Aldersonia sp. NBC_00410]|uniref:SDR family oxidoreductase n=1 Tax=Aldersonia sp. NBC_00410 TaxID=2975954 RepID=UPI00224EB0A6|nr:SDR family oxidoreductase [Aldersonia sp. NBC_00410]MCX5043492.1 SDR family oxidoreductase [Aldersonia sp. NBC_00410]
MILVAGGTGTLGTRIVRALATSGTPVRILTRAPSRAGHLTGPGVEVHLGDVRDPEAVAAAMKGVTAVVSAVQGFAGTDPAGAQAVDLDGNSNLVNAAIDAGARRFVLISATGAASDSPLSLRRIKFQAEQALIHSDLEWTIIRPTVYLETWIGLLGDMITAKGSVTLFGRGRNPINFVGADDVAALVAHTVGAPDLVGETLAIGGPENLTLNDVAGKLLVLQGQNERIRHVAIPVLRVVSTVLRPIKPTVATLAEFGIIMDTTDMTLPRDTARARVPGLPTTRLADLLARVKYAA